MGGFTVYSPERELHYAASLYYGPDFPINNVVEMQSLINLATWLHQHYPISLDHTIMIIDDSHLIIDFCIVNTPINT